MASRLAPNVEEAIARAASRTGVDPGMLRTFVMIESGGRPDTTTGSYRGLLQLSPSEYKKYGGTGDIHDIDGNLAAGAMKIRSESAGFKERYGRDPTPTELYMIHQQGIGGSAAHMARPDRPAWENMYSTAEGRERGPEWARRAIWGNVPDDVKARYGSVDNMTSADFVKMWGDKVSRFSGAPSAPAIPPPAAMPPTAAATPDDAAPWKPATPLTMDPAPFGMAGPPTTAPTAEAPSTVSAWAPTVSPEASSPFGLSAGDPKQMAALQQQMSAQAKEPDPMPQQLAMGGGRPVDLKRLMSVLQNRSRLGSGGMA